MSVITKVENTSIDASGATLYAALSQSARISGDIQDAMFFLSDLGPSSHAMTSLVGRTTSASDQITSDVGTFFSVGATVLGLKQQKTLFERASLTKDSFGKKIFALGLFRYTFKSISLALSITGRVFKSLPASSSRTFLVALPILSLISSAFGIGAFTALTTLASLRIHAIRGIKAGLENKTDGEKQTFLKKKLTLNPEEIESLKKFSKTSMNSHISEVLDKEYAKKMGTWKGFFTNSFHDLLKGRKEFTSYTSFLAHNLAEERGLLSKEELKAIKDRYARDPEYQDKYHLIIENAELAKKGKIDHLSRILSPSLVEKVLKGEKIDFKEVHQTLRMNHILWGIITAGAVLSIGLSILGIVASGGTLLIALKVLSLVVNLWWVGVDGYSFSSQVKEGTISTKQKVIYIALSILAVGGIICASVASGGIVPLAIGIATLIATIGYYLYRYYEHRKQQLLLEEVAAL